MTPAAGADDARFVRNVWLTVAGLVVLRLIAAAVTPITFDEAYYWMWSKHLVAAITTTRRWSHG